MKRMLCKYRLWLLMTVELVGSLSLSAQEAHPRAASDFLDLQGGVTETELVTRALASNPSLLARRQQIAMAKGDVTQARLRQNPSLTLGRSEEHTSELQSLTNLVCRLLLEKKKKNIDATYPHRGMEK